MPLSDIIMLTAVVGAFLLFGVVLAWGEPYDSPLWASRRDGLAYVCQHYACQSPTDDPAVLRAQLTPA